MVIDYYQVGDIVIRIEADETNKKVTVAVEQQQ